MVSCPRYKTRLLALLRNYACTDKLLEPHTHTHTLTCPLHWYTHTHTHTHTQHTQHTRYYTRKYVQYCIANHTTTNSLYAHGMAEVPLYSHTDPLKVLPPPPPPPPCCCQGISRTYVRMCGTTHIQGSTVQTLAMQPVLTPAEQRERTLQMCS